MNRFFADIEMYGVCDLVPERAQKGVDFVKVQQEQGDLCCHTEKLQ